MRLWLAMVLFLVGIEQARSDVGDWRVRSRSDQFTGASSHSASAVAKDGSISVACTEQRKLEIRLLSTRAALPELYRLPKSYRPDIIVLSDDKSPYKVKGKLLMIAAGDIFSVIDEDAARQLATEFLRAKQRIGLAVAIGAGSHGGVIVSGRNVEAAVGTVMRHCGLKP